MSDIQVFLANWFSVAAGLLPFGYSFGAGMVSTVNPCGFTLLPAYLSLYLGGEEGQPGSNRILARGGRAILFGTMVTLGFILLFTLSGLIIWAGGHVLMQYLPWFGLFIGVALVVLGVLQFMGKSIYTSFPARVASLLGNPSSQGPNTYFLFGIGYGTASLSCTLPVFMVVVGSAIMAKGLSFGLLQFLGYALGMGFVLILLTLSAAFFKGGLALYLKKALPYMGKVAGVLLVAAGTYQIYYWLTKGGLLS